MPSIADARDALKAQIQTVVRCYDYSPPQIAPPCAVIGLPTSYDVSDTYGDTATLVIPISVYVPYSAPRAAEDAMEKLLATSGATSIVAAIEDTGVGYAVTAIRDFGLLDTTQGQPMALGCTIEVTVYA